MLNGFFDQILICTHARHFTQKRASTLRTLRKMVSQVSENRREDSRAMKPFNDLTGRKFGFLRVIAYAGTDDHRRRMWRVQCEQCGRTKRVLAANLLSGRSKSCGCVAYSKARTRMKWLMLGEKMANGMTMEQAKVEFDAWLGIP
jgi:hypothetical protein